MKLTSSVLFLVIFICTANVSALEPVEEQQAFLYYQVPFGGVKKVDNAHKFGLRIDRVTVDRRTGQYSDSVNFSEHIRKPASLDLQMGHAGIRSFKMHGYDYLPYLVSQAGEGEGEGSVAGDNAGGVEASEQGTGEQESGQQESGETEKSEEEHLEFSDVVNQTSFGILIGVGVGILALTGFGG